MALPVFDLISDLIAAPVLVNAVNACVIVRQLEAFSHLNGNIANNPEFNVLGDSLCCQIRLDKYLEDVTAIFFLAYIVHTGFKLCER